MKPASPQIDLSQQLSELGWQLNKIEFKNGQYVAKGVGPGEQNIERTGKSPEMALAALIGFASRSNQIRQFAAQLKTSAWQTDWLTMKDEIAQAYQEMPAYDMKAVPAWRALGAESKIQADAIRRQISVEVIDGPDPYYSVQNLCADVHNNRHLTVTRDDAAHPIWTTDDMMNFRIVHDVIGYCQSGGDWTWAGENKAVAQMMPLLSALAREALFTEVIGRTAYDNTFRGRSPHKIGLLNDYLHPAQEAEGEHVFVPHGAIPTQVPGLPPQGVGQPQPQVFSSTEESDPDYIFIYFMGQLKIEPWHHNRHHKDMFQELLKEHGTDIPGFANEFESADVATGTVREKSDGAIEIEQEGFVKPDVDLMSRLAIRDWLDSGDNKAE